MVMEGDLHWGGEHTVRCTDNVLWDCAPEICIFLLTSVTPINSINRKKKEFCLLQGHKDTLPCFLYSLLKVSFQTLNFPHWLCCHLFFFLYSCGTRKITLLHTLPVLYLGICVYSKSSLPLHIQSLCAEHSTRATFEFKCWVCEKGVFEKNT